MKAREEFLSLTPKGIEALRGHAPKLDAISKTILSLIQQGSTSEEAILQRSKSPRDVVSAALRLLLRDRYVGSATSDRISQSGASDASTGTGSTNVRLSLKLGVSPSQARFTLANFCLDCFGANGQELADVIDLCSDVFGLQQALNAIRAEVDKRCPDQLPALVACVKEINDTDF